MQSCSENLSAFFSANETISLPSAMPAALDGLGIITSIARPRGCHGSASGRTPPMFLISGNAALMLRAAKIVLTCRPRSSATPTGSSFGGLRLPTRHRDALDAGAMSPGSALTLDNAHVDDVGAVAVTCKRHGAAPATESARSGLATASPRPP